MLEGEISSEYDVVVAGGGLSGICAAIAAARSGVKVALVHDRALLGGNASGELKVHVAGADGSGMAIARYLRESGIIDELRIENLCRNPANSADIFSLILREYVQAESNIDLYMNTRIMGLDMASEDKIESVEAFQLTTEKRFLFKGRIFIDCTGDGFLAAMAGAEFRIGREAKDEFNESLAPDKADSKTLPSCVEFYLRDMGRSVKFEPPTWAYKYESDSDLPYRTMNPEDWHFAGVHGGFWWLSAGGDISTISDNEEIYNELLKVVMGLWDHMKNRGDHGAENFALEWISPIAGKRESRRIEGDYQLNQNDVLEGKIFDDRVAYGGWPIDIHPPEGIFSKEPPNLHVSVIRPYTIPLSCLYSKNISNLFMAGRDASFTHVGLGSARVMATCAVAGLAAGVAAALAVKEKITPREVRQNHIKRVQQQLLKAGAYIPYCLNEDENDIARIAEVAASSEATLTIAEKPGDAESFEHRLFQLFPVSAKSIDGIEILIESDQQTTFTAGIRKAKDIWDFSSEIDLATAEANTKKAGRQWIKFNFDLKNIDTGLYWIWVNADNADAKWLGTKESPIALVRGKFERPELAPEYKTMRGAFIFRLSPESRPYVANNVVNGVARCQGWTNCWMSEKLSKSGQWLELKWDEPVSISEVQIVFDGAFDSNITWPEPLGVFGCEVLPAVAKKYDIAVKIDGGWKVLTMVDKNYHYRRLHRFESVETSAVRINIYETNGAAEARVFEVRVY